MATYLFVTDPESHGDEVKDVQAGTDYSWSCSKTALPGDSAIVYLVGGAGIKYEWQITSQAEPDERWGYMCDVCHVRTFKPPISLHEICSVISKAEWAPPHLHFRGYWSIRIPDQVAERLRSLRPRPRTKSNRTFTKSSSHAKREKRSSVRGVR